MKEAKEIRIASISEARGQQLADSAGVRVPIEQTSVWGRYLETFPGRQYLGCYLVSVADTPSALVCLTRYPYHGFHFLAANGGPVWLIPPTPQNENLVAVALRDWAKKKWPLTAFLRLHLFSKETPGEHPLQLVAYDRTVEMVLQKDLDSLIAGLKKRRRTQVRSDLRRHPLTIADETSLGQSSFREYHALLQETAARQGFQIWDIGVYQNLLQQLGHGHARLFTAREEGHLVGWAIVTLQGEYANYLYASSSPRGLEIGAPRQILVQSGVELANEGYKFMDLMGVGSEEYPELDHLNNFKSGFAPGLTEVAPAVDIPVNVLVYRFLKKSRSLKRQTRAGLAQFRDRFRSS